ncbi:MAG TPA: glycosyltransferase family 4 protein [Thermomicrobiales bacterium]|jgi:glycosyltransferase involved in cell wall biosynthesis
MSGIPHRPRVAYLTPLSPVGSGISYYSEDLLPTLARALDLSVFVDGYMPTLAAPLRAAGITLRQGREFERALRTAPFDATIYQLGNSPAHAYMYDWALREPGIAVLHDAMLHHLRLWMAINGGRARRREYTDELREFYGAAGEALAREVLRGKTPTALFDYPLIEPILDKAKAVVVHNAASAERIRAMRPGGAVHVVPMGVPLPTLPPREAARARLGITPEAFVVLSLGHANPYKRLDVALRAFRRLTAEQSDALFIIAGSEAPSLGATLDRQIGYLGLGARVRRLGFVAPETVADLLAAADCCVNLRYPSAGETSASLLRIMGAGLPVLVSDAGSFRELPAGSAMVVPVGPIEEPLLAEYLIALARDGSLRAGLGETAREFVAAEHSLERSALGYLDALAVVTGRPIALPPAALTRTVDVGRADKGRRLVVSGEHNQPIPFDVPPDEGLDDDPVLDAVVKALTDLRLAGHEPTVRSVAGDLVALGLTGEAARPRRSGNWRARWRLAWRR